MASVPIPSFLAPNAVADKRHFEGVQQGTSSDPAAEQERTVLLYDDSGHFFPLFFPVREDFRQVF